MNIDESPGTLRQRKYVIRLKNALNGFGATNGHSFFYSNTEFRRQKKKKNVFTRNDLKVNKYCPDAIKRKQLKLHRRCQRFPKKNKNK